MDLESGAEQKIELSEERPSIDSLDEYHLLDVFQWLKFEDLINLAETCTKFKQVVCRIFDKSTILELDRKQRVNISSSELELVYNVSEEGVDQYIDRLLVHVGPHISSLKIFCNEKYSCSRLMKHVDCKKLKSIEIGSLEEACQNDLFVPKCLYSCRNVELLTLYNVSSLKTFLETFHKLKCFNIMHCNIEFSDLRMVFQNNPEISSFVFNGRDFDCQLLELIPKIEKLSLDVHVFYDEGNISNLNTLLTLNQLSKLRLNCHNKNLNNFFVDLARKGVIEELELHCAQIDSNSLKTLKTFDKLQLLTIYNSGPADAELDSSLTSLPPQLKVSLHTQHIDLS